MAKVLLWLPPVLFVGLATMFLVGMNRDNADDPRPTETGKMAPAIVLTQLGEKPSFSDADLRVPGAKLVNFFASWCTPCRAEHPLLTRLAAEGVTVYGVNYKDKPDDALGFLAELGDPYTAIGADQGAMAQSWGVYGLPETFVIDGDGRIALRFSGPISLQELERTIRPALAKAAK